MPALYPGAGAKIVTVISRMKNVRSCCGMEKKHPKVCPVSMEQLLFLCAAADSKRSVLGPGYKI